MVRRCLIWRVARGWYSTRVDATEEDRHILRAVAALRMQQDRSFAGHHTAVLLHGIALARADLSVVQLARTSGAHGRIREGVRISELDSGLVRVTERVEPITGATVPVVDPASAIVGTAMNNNPIAALVAGDDALHRGVCRREDIDAALAARRGHRGVAAARAVLEHLEARHESPGETLTAVVLRKGRWAFDPQVEAFGRGRRYRIDFALREATIAIEFDGDCKYTDPSVMEAQLAREADLRAEGWDFVRVVWGDLDDEEDILRRVEAAAVLARAAA